MEDEINLEDDFINKRNQVKNNFKNQEKNYNKDITGYIGSSNYMFNKETMYSKGSRNASFSKLYDNTFNEFTEPKVGYADYHNNPDNLQSNNITNNNNSPTIHQSGQNNSNSSAIASLKFQKIRELNLINKYQNKDQETSPRLGNKKSEDIIAMYDNEPKPSDFSSKKNNVNNKKDYFATLGSSNQINTLANPEIDQPLEYESRRRKDKLTNNINNIEKGKMDTFKNVKFASNNTIVQVKQDMNEIYESRRNAGLI